MGQINQQAYHGFACAKIHDQPSCREICIGRETISLLEGAGKAHQWPRFHGLIGGRSDVAVQAAPTLPGGCPPPDATSGPTAAAPWSDSPDVTPCPSPHPTLPLRHRPLNLALGELRDLRARVPHYKYPAMPEPFRLKQHSKQQKTSPGLQAVPPQESQTTLRQVPQLLASVCKQ
jgi:hypothetical protein